MKIVHFPSHIHTSSLGVIEGVHSIFLLYPQCVCAVFPSSIPGSANYNIVSGDVLKCVTTRQSMTLRILVFFMSSWCIRVCH